MGFLQLPSKISVFPLEECAGLCCLLSEHEFGTWEFDMEEQFAPYAPAKSVLLPINRYRERGLNWPLTAKSLEQIGVPDSMAPRTLQALRFLGLVGEDDQATESFKRIKQASEEEYPSQLAEVIRAAYLPVFSIVDPGRDGDVAIVDAFRRYDPSAQREKLVALFRGLCMEAGIIQPKSRPRETTRSKPRADGQPKTNAATPKAPTGQKQPPPDPAQRDGQGHEGDGGVDLRLITAIIQQLPRGQRWTAARRAKWIQTMTAAVDLLFETEEGGGDEEGVTPSASLRRD